MGYSLYLAEDEEWIRRGINKMIPWEELKLTSAGETDDGREALEEIRRIRPDILVTDIRMPSLNGLEMAEKAVKDLPGLKVIVISGFKEFEYARQALNLGAVRYILKPIDKAELHQVLQQAIESIEREKGAREDRTAGENAALLHLLENGVAQERIWPQNTRWAMVAVIRCREAQATAYRLYVQAAQKAAGDRIEIRTYLRPNGECGLLLQSGCEQVDTKRINARMEDFLFQLPEALADATEIFLGSAVEYQRDVPISYRTAKRQAARRCVAQNNIRTGKIHLYQTSGKPKAPSPNAVQIDGLRLAMETNDRGKIRAAVQKITTELISATPDLTVGEAADFMLLLCFEMLRPLQHQGINTGAFYEQCRMMTRMPSGQQTLERLALWTSDFLVDVAGSMERSRDRSAEVAVAETVEYIKRHFDEDISLTSLSKLVHMNYSYLSSAFKKVCGCHFSEYLLKIRLERAAELLKQSQMSVSQISQMVGYDNVRYFSQVFRKYYLCTPSEYRAEAFASKEAAAR